MSDARFQNLLSRDEALLDKNHSMNEMLGKQAASWEEQTKFGECLPAPSLYQATGRI